MLLLCVSIFVIIIITIGIYMFFRKKYIKFTNEVVNKIDDLILERFDSSDLNSETLNSKINSKLYKLKDITQNKLAETNLTKSEIESMISDITHQIKTPISNIRMYSDTIINNDLDENKEKEFLRVISEQVDKMEFLTDSLNKMSKLETNLITLNKQSSKLSECIEKAVEQEIFLAESKNIDIEIMGDQGIILNYDKKWTLEAICNVLENAIKYTNNEGKIIINIEKLEVFTRINIQDNGIGISPENINNIFKRFYREPKVHNIRRGWDRTLFS